MKNCHLYFYCVCLIIRNLLLTYDGLYNKKKGASNILTDKHPKHSEGMSGVFVNPKFDIAL